MCGLFAVIPIGEQSRRRRDQLRQLFMWLGAVNDDRGGHSWGVWSRDNGTRKGTGCFLSNARAINKMIRGWRAETGSWLAGHTRYATHGAKTVANAHPFNYGNVTLAHNGILEVWGSVTGKVPDVDSAHLAKYLSEQLHFQPDKPFEEVFKSTIADVSGSIGLLMSDEVGNLRAYASCQELHLAQCDWGYAISSSKFHLETALDAAGLEAEVIVAVAEDCLIAPWYRDVPDVYAPSMAYSRYFSSGVTRKTWADYKKEDTISSFNSFYAGAEAGASTLGVHDLSSDYPVEEVGTERPGDWQDLEDSLCELCSSRKIGKQPAVWTDPDSQRLYLICPDCDQMFNEMMERGITSRADDDIVDAREIEAKLDAIEALEGR